MGTFINHNDNYLVTYTWCDKCDYTYQTFQNSFDNKEDAIKLIHSLINDENILDIKLWISVDVEEELDGMS